MPLLTPAATTPAEPEVLLHRRGRLAHIQLNRPRAINALTHGMVGAITGALIAWQADESVDTVLLTGSGDRGLCAGGDIVSIYRDAGATGEDPAHRATAAFWADEYALNALIARYSKPYVAVMDGLVLGGGVGVSAHGGIRLVTERTRLGMPETGIGFVPDVGGTWLLAHAPGELGTHLALTAGMVSGTDALALGLADHLVESGRIPELIAALETTPASVAVARFAVAQSAVAQSEPAQSEPAPSGPAPTEPAQSGPAPSGPAPSGPAPTATVANHAATPRGTRHGDAEPPRASALAAARGWIDACYSGDSVPGILEALDASDAPEAHAAALAIRAKSPTAVSVALASLRRCRSLPSLEAALDQEYRVSLRCLAAPDMREGIRAQVIDRDRTPTWSPAGLAEVSPADVDAYFASLGADELGLACAPDPTVDIRSDQKATS